MRFPIKDIAESGTDVRVPVTEAWMTKECPDLDARPDGLQLTGRLLPGGDTFILTGRIAGALFTTCSRCLEAARVPLDIPVAVSFVEKSKLVEDDADGNLEGTDVLGFEDEIIDLGPEIRDEILLFLPQSNLCREDCAGLCPVCGGNRNQTVCFCVEQQKVKSSKFADLAKLKS